MLARTCVVRACRDPPATDVLRRCLAGRPSVQYVIDSTLARSCHSKLADKTRKVHEVPIVQRCGGDVMRYMGTGSRFQMYCSLMLAGSLVYQADASAHMMEVLATSGAIASASVGVFFGAKQLCDRVVTDIVSCRRVGDPHEFVRVSVLGVGVKEVLEVSPNDVKLLGHDGKDVYSFALGGRRLQLDTSTGECLNRKALDILMQGKPLVSRKRKQSKQRSHI